MASGAVALVCTLAIILSPLAGQAQEVKKVYRVGYLNAGPPPLPPVGEVVRVGLRELGWIEGQNLIIESRFAESRFERLPGLVADLLRLNVDVIVGHSTPVVMAVKQATRTVPVVMTSGDPVRLGLVTSLARPGGNITGVSVQTIELRPKSLQLLKELVPEASRFGFLVRPDNPAVLASWRDLETAARALGVEMRRFDARGAADIERAFAAMARDGVGGLIVPADYSFISLRRHITDLAAKRRLPVIYPGREFVEAGGLMSYAQDHQHVGRRLASYVDRVLKGAKPADLPIEQATKFEMIVNLKAAAAIGLRIPEPVLERADSVIR